MIPDLFAGFAEGIAQNSNKGIVNTLEDAQMTTSSVIFSDLAYLSKSQLDIDKSTMNILNNDQAQKMLLRKYRAPYQHPYTA